MFIFIIDISFLETRNLIANAINTLIEVESEIKAQNLESIFVILTPLEITKIHESFIFQSDLSEYNFEDLKTKYKVLDDNILFLISNKKYRHLLEKIDYTYCYDQASLEVISKCKYYGPAFDQKAIPMTITDFLLRHRSIIQLK